MADTPEPKSVLVSVLVFVSIVFSVFAVSTVVLYYLYGKQIEQENEEFTLAIETALSSMEPDTIDIYRPQSGYSLVKPSEAWERYAELETDVDLVLKHPDFGIASIAVLDSTGEPRANLIRWMETRMSSLYIEKRGHWEQRIDGRPASVMELELRDEDEYFRHWIVATATPVALLIDFANAAGSFARGQNDYRALLDSIRLLPHAPTATPLSADPSQPYRGGPVSF